METEGKKQEEMTHEQKTDFMWVNFWKDRSDLDEIKYKIERLLIQHGLVYDPTDGDCGSGYLLIWRVQKVETKMKWFQKINIFLIAAIFLLFIMNLALVLFLYKFH